MATKLHDRQVEHRNNLPRLSDDAKPTLKTVLPTLDQEITPMFELRESGTPDLTVNVGAGKITNSDTGLSRTFSPIRNQFFEFASGTVTFPASSGNPIVVSPAPVGVSENLTLTVGNFIAALVQINSLGEITVVTGIEAATPALAVTPVNFPPHFTTSLPIGYVILENAGGVIQNIVNEVITQFEIGGGGGGSGDANSDITRYQQRLELSPFEYANTNVAEIDEDDQLDVSSVVQNDVASGTFKFAENLAQALLSTQQLDSDFLAEGVELSTIELYAIWELDNIETAGIYEASRDGTNFQTLTMERIGNSDAYRGVLNFVDEPSNAFSQEYAFANADSAKDFDSSTSEEISQKFTVNNATTFKNVFAYINKATVASAGVFSVEVVRDDAGSPSSDPNDVMWTSPFQSVAGLSVGDNGVDISSQFVLPADDYHLVFKTDDAYKTAYDSNNADKISLRMDSSAGPTPNLRTYNGTVWSAEVANETAVYRLEGRELDLRVRITSSATAEDKLLSSYGIYYKYEDGVNYTKPVFREIFEFDGTVDNDNEFLLEEFLPDSRLLMCFALGTGQVFRYGDFVLDGHKVVFPPNTFNVVGTVRLEFFQMQAVDTVAGSVSDALLTANHLGSTDPNIDKSVAGYGIFLRRPDGTLRELTIDNNDNVKIYSV